jgi:hypothetical protein
MMKVQGIWNEFGDDHAVAVAFVVVDVVVDVACSAFAVHVSFA